MARHQCVGACGEEIGAAFLTARGFRVCTRNYRTRWGEIDLIVEQRETLHFVEVKTTTRGGQQEPAEWVTAKKRQTIARVAGSYLALHRIDVAVAFSVLTVNLSVHPPQCHWYPAVFDGDGVCW
ncbi:MAG: YraN family protein [Deltaproteobacteria bacterium]|nr:YraN family protein [Deltaproteobacteria bacterium]